MTPPVLRRTENDTIRTTCLHRFYTTALHHKPQRMRLMLEAQSWLRNYSSAGWYLGSHS